MWKNVEYTVSMQAAGFFGAPRKTTRVSKDHFESPGKVVQTASWVIMCYLTPVARTRKNSIDHTFLRLDSCRKTDP